MNNNTNNEAAICRLRGYSINSSTSDNGQIVATAYLTVTRSASVSSVVAVGNGPVDAAFRAVEDALGRKFELKEFEISAITEGRDAKGEANIKLHSNGETFSGSGKSSDIVGASILAYLSAVNKIILKEAETASEDAEAGDAK
jgi:2-isopropylmalate synthase